MSRNSASDFLSRSAEAGVKPRIEACAAGTWFVGVGEGGCGNVARNAASISNKNANIKTLIRSELCFIDLPNQFHEIVFSCGLTRCSSIPLTCVILSGAPRRAGTYEIDGRAVEGSRGIVYEHAAAGSSPRALSF